MSTAPEASSSTPDNVKMADASSPEPAAPVHESFRPQPPADNAPAPSDPMAVDPKPEAPPAQQQQQQSAASPYAEADIAKQMRVLDESLDAMFSPDVELKTHDFLARLTQAARDMDIVDGWLAAQSLSPTEFPNLDNNTLYAGVKTKLMRIMRDISNKSIEHLQSLPGDPLSAEEKAAFSTKNIFGEAKLPREQYAVVSATASNVLSARRSTFSRSSLEAQATGTGASPQQKTFGSTPLASKDVQMGEAAPARFGYREFAKVAATPSQLVKHTQPNYPAPVAKRPRESDVTHTFGYTPLKHRAVAPANVPAEEAQPKQANPTLHSFVNMNIGRSGAGDYGDLWSRVNRNYNARGVRTGPNAVPLTQRVMLPGQTLSDGALQMLSALKENGVLRA